MEVCFPSLVVGIEQGNFLLSRLILILYSVF